MTIIPTSDALDQPTCMRQIRKLAECINSRDGGMISDIDFDKESNTYVMVITFADGTSQRFEWDTSPIDISSMTGSVSNGNLTITIFMSNGSSHAFTCPLNGMATESYVDTKDAQNVKKTGTNVVTGDIQVPTTPITPMSVVNSVYVNDATEGVNNIVHKDGWEIINGFKRAPYINSREWDTANSSRWIRLLKINVPQSDLSVGMKWLVDLIYGDNIDEDIATKLSNSLIKRQILMEAYVQIIGDAEKEDRLNSQLVEIENTIISLKNQITWLVPKEYQSDKYEWEYNGIATDGINVRIYER